MKDLDTIGKDLFDKIRGRFTSVTIGGEDGKVTNEPSKARFFDFEYSESSRALGNVSIQISEDDGLTIIYSKDIVANEDSVTKDNWFNFLKDMRQFSKKRLLDFDVRDITKSNLTKRDYKFLSKKRFGDDNMNESKLYGTARTSYQKVGEARIMIKHTENVNLEASNPRTKKIGTIYIESAGGERFKYPFKHLSGARAMARHVSEGGNLYDDFGSHIIGLSEEMAKLRKFKSYMGRSAVMAESLSEYVDVVKDRINTVRKTITSLQKPKFYAEAFATYEAPILEDVPADVAENWTDQLTIKQFNEELADVFPYIYKLVSEATKAQELGPDDLVREAKADPKVVAKEEKNKKTKEEIAVEHGFEEMMGQFSEDREISAENFRGAKAAEAAMISHIAAMHDADGYEEVHDQLAKMYQQAADMFYDEDPQAMEIYKKANKIEKENGLDEMMGQFSEGGMSDIDIQAQEFAQDAVEMAKDIQKDDYYFSDSTYFEFTDGLDMDNDALIDHDLVQAVLRALPNVDMEPEEIKQAVDALANMNIGEDNEKPKGSFEPHPGAFDWDANMDDDDEDSEVDKITPKKDKKTPLGEFILSYFDRENGVFPKGETAVLTMVEKDYGEEFINPAKSFIEQVSAKFEEYEMRNQPQQMETDNEEYDRIRELAGLR